MNKCILIGRLTRDPELSQTTTGIAVCKFSLAVSRKFANVNGERETDFFNIVAWRGLAENCAKFIFKGSKVAITGNIQNRNYEDKDGIKRYATDISAEDVEFLDSKNENKGDNAPSKKNASELKPIEADEGLPF